MTASDTALSCMPMPDIRPPSAAPAAFSFDTGPVQMTRQRGFTLMELAVVLVVIGLILGAVAVGRDVQRNAAYQQQAMARFEMEGGRGAFPLAAETAERLVLVNKP